MLLEASAEARYVAFSTAKESVPPGRWNVFTAHRGTDRWRCRLALAKASGVCRAALRSRGHPAAVERPADGSLLIRDLTDRLSRRIDNPCERGKLGKTDRKLVERQRDRSAISKQPRPLDPGLGRR
jgi:hypothetical protein